MPGGVFNGPRRTRLGVAFPVGKTLGQTASFRQTAPETWCQSRVFRPHRPARREWSNAGLAEVQLPGCDSIALSPGGRTIIAEAMRIRCLALCLAAAFAAAAQNYAGPLPPQVDLPYLKHAENLVPTEVLDAKERSEEHTSE